jgi:hypothetical protein
MSDNNYHILFWPDVNYEPGHWRPVMSMAQKVKKWAEKEKEIINCDIKFLCTPECQPIIERVLEPNGDRVFGKEEIETVLKDLFPVGYSSLASQRPEEAHSRINHCLKIASGAFDGLLKNFQPRLLIAGYFVSMEALLIKYRYDNVVRKILEDEFVSEDGSVFTPPPEMEIIITTTYLRHPNEDPAITSLRFLAHHAPEHSSKLMQAAFGNSAESRRFNGSLSSVKEFIEPLEDVVELITCPHELDHDDFKHRENTYYVEPCILDTNPEHNPVKDVNLIYTTAGSRVRDYVESAKSMFQALERMINITAAKNRKLEMAVGYTLREEFDSTDKITIKEWADQADCLKRARSAIIHGGLASIKECIYFGIPPIVIPMGKDQMDNAIRVVDREVGSMLMLDDLTEHGLYNAIMKAELNTGVKKQLNKMRNRFRELEETEPSMEHIIKALGLNYVFCKGKLVLQPK